MEVRIFMKYTNIWVYGLICKYSWHQIHIKVISHKVSKLTGNVTVWLAAPLQTTKKTKLHITGPLWEGSINHWWIPLTKGKVLDIVTSWRMKCQIIHACICWIISCGHLKKNRSITIQCLLNPLTHIIQYSYNSTRSTFKLNASTVLTIQLFMMTSSNGNIFRVTGLLCGEFTGHRWIPLTKDLMAWSFDVFFDMHLNKRLSKQSWGWWFETPSCSLIRHRNGFCTNMGLDLGQCCAWWCQDISSQSVDYDVTITVSGVVQQTINKYGTVDSGFNSFPPSATYMCQWIRSTLVQIMGCRLLGAKPLSKPMLGYCHLDS